MVSVEGQAPELRLRVDGLHHRARRRKPQVARVLRRGAGQRARPATLTADKAFCDTYHADGRGLRRQDLVLDHADRAVPRRPHRRQVHRLRRLDPGLDRDQGLTAASATGRSQVARRGSHRPPRAALGLLLAPPMLWLGVAYLGGAGGALRHLAVDAERLHRRASSGVWTLDNYRDLFTIPVYRTIAFRTIGIAALVTVVDARARVPDRALHGEGRLAARPQRLLVIAVLMPLWASYLVKAYAWRGMLSPRRADRLARQAVRHPLAGLRADGHGRSRWPTCGCRT